MAAADSSSFPLLATANIQLTAQESRLQYLLREVVRYIDDSKELTEHLELRFAGGWVRDKLLGIPSNDIDTAINAMTGHAFSCKLVEYLQDPVNLIKHGISEKDFGNIHKIAANPNKSKHLETVTMRLLGYDIDFVNLRKETYSEDSRTPQMEFGTAQEDALRRDATINALFYNIHTDQVEDFAGGLMDLQGGLIRTPLEPHQTFIDDPLRVLRLIRFASRLNFVLENETRASMSDDSIKSALRLKISRERIGHELEKMLKETDPSKPRKALQLIDDLNLYSTIFTNPSAKSIVEPRTNEWHLAYDFLHWMISQPIYKFLVYKELISTEIGQRHEDAPFLAWNLAALAPWYQFPLPLRDSSTNKLMVPHGAGVAREGIKSPSRVVNVVAGAFRNFGEIVMVKRAVIDRAPWIQERDTLGMKIRRWDRDGGYWRLQVLFAILVEIMQLSGEKLELPTRNRLINPKSNDGVFEVDNNFLSDWEIFLDHLQRMDLLNAESMEPLLDGTDLKRELGATPGKWIAAALSLCLEWQFRNPGVTDSAAVIHEIRSRSEELQISFKEP